MYVRFPAIDSNFNPNFFYYFHIKLSFTPCRKEEGEGNPPTSLPIWSVLVSHWSRRVINFHADFPRTRAPCSCLLGDAQRAQAKCCDRSTRSAKKTFKVAHMAKQSSLFNFFTKSPPPVSKSKPSPSPTLADLPSVARSNSSPKEQAKETPQQRKAKTKSVTPKNNPKPPKLGINKLFNDKAAAAKQK